MSEEHVNHPKHYNREGGMECIDEMVLIFGVEETKTFCKLNAWKYRYRAADKNGEEDLKKSDWYLRKYKELSEGNATPQHTIITLPPIPEHPLNVPVTPNMPWYYADKITTTSPDPNFKTVITC